LRPGGGEAAVRNQAFDRYDHRKSPDLAGDHIDTNILVAAFRSSLGASYKLLQTLEQRRWRPVISPALALEYESGFASLTV
jgi:hypothetical protein